MTATSRNFQFSQSAPVTLLVYPLPFGRYRDDNGHISSAIVSFVLCANGGTSAASKHTHTHIHFSGGNGVRALFFTHSNGKSCCGNKRWQIIINYMPRLLYVYGFLTALSFFFFSFRFSLCAVSTCFVPGLVGMSFNHHLGHVGMGALHLRSRT